MGSRICLTLRALLACCALLGALHGELACAGINKWTTNSPPGGTIKKVVASAANDSIMYAAMERSIDKSTDGGASWQTLRNFYGYTVDIAVSPADPNLLLVSVAGEGLFRSTDGGETLVSIVTSPFANSYVDSVAITSTTLYYSNYLGFHASTDGGQTWEQRAGPSTNSRVRLVVDDAFPDLIHSYYPGQWNGIERSVDGGRTWTSTAVPGATTLYDIEVISPATLVAAAGDGVYVTNDGGMNWSRRMLCNCVAIAKDPRTATSLLLSANLDFSTGSLFRSDDSGLNWSFLAATPYSAAEHLMIRRQAPMPIVMANSIGVQISSDLGASWTQANPGHVGFATIDFSSFGTASGRLAAYSNDSQLRGIGLFVRDGANWRRLNLAAAENAANFGQRLYNSFVRVKPGIFNTLFLVTSRGILRSADGGDTWVVTTGIPSFSNIRSLEFDPADPNIMYAGCISSGNPNPAMNIYRSIDSGRTWSVLPMTLPNQLRPARLLIDPANGQRQFVIAVAPDSPYGSGTLLRTTNGGQSWVGIVPAQTINNVVVNGNSVFVATDTALLVSENGGDFVSKNDSMPLATALGARAITVDPIAPDTIYVLTYSPVGYSQAPLASGAVLRSPDRGQSWEVLRTITESPTWDATSIALDPLDPTTVYVGTRYRGVASFEVAVDLAVSIVGHLGTSRAGAISNFEVRVQNRGPYAATRVQVAVTLPPGVTNVFNQGTGSTCALSSNSTAKVFNCEFPVVRSGTTASVTINYTAPTPMAIPVTATVASHQRELTPQDNVHAVTASAVEVVDLEPTVVAASNAVNVGEPLTFNVQASNKGPSIASSATLIVTVPSNLTVTSVPSGCSTSGGTVSCNVGAIAAGAAQAFAVVTMPRDSGLQTVEARLSAAPTATDSNPTNNVAIASALVRAEADVSVTVNDSVDPVPAGEVFDYRVVVHNAGPKSVGNVVATLNRTGGISSTITSTHGGCAGAAGGVRCDLGTLDAGASALIVISVSSGGSGTISLQANVTSNGNDTVSANDADQETTTVQSVTSAPKEGGGSIDRLLLAALIALCILRFRSKAALPVLICFCSAGYVSPATAGLNEWTVKGPPGGYIYRHALSPSNDNVIYAASYRVLHRSMDAGATWQAMAYVDGYVYGLAVDPVDSNRVYVSVESRGLFRSDDGGRTLTPISTNGQSAFAIVANGSALYRCVGTDIQRSTDRGTTWSAHGTSPEPLQNILFSDSNPNVLLALSGWASGALRSVNGGVSWAKMTISPITIPGTSPVYDVAYAGATSWVATTPDGIYTSRDDGATWTRTRQGYTGGGIARDPNSQGTVYAGWGFPGFYLLRSTDYGATWQLAGLPLEASTDDLIVHRSGRITVLGAQGVYFSTNGAMTWTESTQGPVGSYMADMAVSSGASPRVFAVVGDGSGGLFSTIQDSTWQRIDLSAARRLHGSNAGPRNLAIRPGSDNVFVTSNSGMGILTSLDGGVSWRRSVNPAGLIPNMLTYGGNPAALFAYAPSDPSLPSQTGGLFRSLDDGATWTPFGSGLAPDFYQPKLVVDPSNSSRFYLTARGAVNLENAGFYRSLDGGINWTRGLLGTYVRDVAVHPTQGAVLVAAQNGLQVSGDGGATFSPNAALRNITAQPPIAIAIDPQIPTTMYVAIYPTDFNSIPESEWSSQILRSVDAGQSWEILLNVSERPKRQISRLVLDPIRPSILYAPADWYGATSFEVAPDLVASISGHSGARTVGQDSSFDMRADNFGPFAANEVRLSASIPAGASITSVTIDRGTCSQTTTSVNCSLGLMRVLDSARAHVTYRVTSAAALQATVTVTAHERDVQPDNNTYTALAYSTPVADLRVTTAASVATANIGDTIVYSAQVRNDGPASSPNSTLTFTPSANQLLGPAPTGCTQSGNSIVCNVGLLAANAASNFAFRVSVTGSGTVAGGVSLVPDASTIDPDSTNNTAVDSVEIRPRGDLSVSVVDTADPATVGAEFEYRIVVGNAGPDAMPNVSVALVNSGNTVRVNTTRGTCTSSSCSLGSLAANATANITVVTNSNITGITSLRATVSADGDDRSMINNSSREFTSIADQKSSAAEESDASTGGSFDDRILAMLALLILWRSWRRMPFRR